MGHTPYLSMNESVLQDRLEGLKEQLAQALRSGAIEPHTGQIRILKRWRRSWLFWRKPVTEASTARWASFEVNYSAGDPPTLDGEVDICWVSDEGDLAAHYAPGQGGTVVELVSPPSDERRLRYWVYGISAILDGHGRKAGSSLGGPVFYAST